MNTRARDPPDLDNRKEEQYLRHPAHLRIPLRKHIRAIARPLDEIREMVLQRLEVGRLVDVLEDLGDDA
jgi:hypothetical protein